MNWGIALSNSFPKKIRIFDTTLRDGEQTPVKKLRIAKGLGKLGVDAIETVFAVASDGEMNAINLIVKEGFRAEVHGFARGLKVDIDAVSKSDAKGMVRTNCDELQLTEVS